MRVNVEADGSQESGNFPIVPEGNYYVKVVDKKDGTTKTERQKVDLLFDIEDATGAKLGSCWHTVSFIPKGAPGHGIWLHTNHALGLPYDGVLDYDTDEYLHRGCNARIIQDTYDKKTRNKISSFFTEDDAPASVVAEQSETYGRPGPAQSQTSGEEECPF